MELVSASPEARGPLLERLHQIEAEADQEYVDLLRKVTSTFVTPFDREDLYEMIETVDDVIDVLDHTGSLIVGIGLGELPAQLVENARGLVTMSQVCARAPRLIKKPKKLEAVLFEVNAIENALDAGYRSVLIEALSVGSDPLEAMRIKTVADSVELASARMEQFIHALGVTAIKET